MIMVVYTGIAASVVLINVSRPLRWRSLAFQAGILPAILSAISCSAERDNLNTDSGMQRQVIGNSVRCQGKLDRAAWTYSSVQRIGTN
jgi:hypothetical protein